MGQIVPITPRELKDVLKRASDESWTEFFLIRPSTQESINRSMMGTAIRAASDSSIIYSIREPMPELPAGNWLRGLKILAWMNCLLTAVGAEPLIQATQLKFLYLRYNQIGNEGVAHLSGLSELISLELMFNQIGDDGLAHLSGLNKLTELDLHGNQISNEGVAHLSRLSQLISLDLTYNQIGDKGVSHLSGLNKLASLKLWGNQIGNEGVSHLSGLSELTSLDMADNQIGNEGVSHLSRLNKLTSLDLAENQIGNEGVAHLSRLSQLISLDLKFNQIGNEGVSHLSGLNKLTELDLFGNQISDEGVAHLSGLSELISLNLRYNQIGDKGVSHLSGLNKLTSLVLADNQIGNEGFDFLAVAWRDRKLSEQHKLDLTENSITRVDPAVLVTRSAQQILDAYFQGRTLPQVRIMFVGMGGVGKSVLAKRCFRDEYLPAKVTLPDETHDIILLRPEDCTAWKPEIQTSDGKKNAEPWVWDFAGQLVTHGVHESFLESEGRTIYVLTLAADRVPEKPIDSIAETEWNRLSYWLQTLHHFVGSKPPVIIAITRCDLAEQKPRKIDTLLDVSESIKERLVDLKPEVLAAAHRVAINGIIDQCSTYDRERSISPLREAITSAIEELTDVTEGKVQPELPDLKKLVESRLRSRTIVPLTEFADWCREIKVEDYEAQNGLLTTLHYLGSIIYFGGTKNRLRNENEPRGIQLARAPESLQDKLFNPRWFKWCVYELARESADDRGVAPNGWFSRDGIERILGRAQREMHRTEHSLLRTTPADTGIICEAVTHIRLCWYDQEQDLYLFPRGLNAMIPLDSDGWPRSELVWRFLPEANFLRLIVEMHLRNHVVRHKGRFQHGRNYVVIEYPRSSGARAVIVGIPDEGRIEIRFDPAGNSKNWPLLLGMVQNVMEDAIHGVKVTNTPIVPPRLSSPDAVPADDLDNNTDSERIKYAKSLSKKYLGRDLELNEVAFIEFFFKKTHEYRFLKRDTRTCFRAAYFLWHFLMPARKKDITAKIQELYWPYLVKLLDRPIDIETTGWECFGSPPAKEIKEGALRGYRKRPQWEGLMQVLHLKNPHKIGNE